MLATELLEDFLCHLHQPCECQCPYAALHITEHELLTCALRCGSPGDCFIAGGRAAACLPTGLGHPNLRELIKAAGHEQL